MSNNPLTRIDPTGHLVQSMDGASDGKKKKASTFTQVMNWFNKTPAEKNLDVYNYLIGEDIKIVSHPDDYSQQELVDAYTNLILMVIPIEGEIAGITAKVARKYGVKVSEEVAIKVEAKLAKTLCNCFTAGTKVLTDEGEKNIEDIKVGDKVLSKNEETGEQAYKKVTALHRNEKDTTYKLSVGNQIIETTDNHPFWVESKGWVLSVDLKVGDELVQSNGNHLKIDTIEIVHHDEKVKVYNFTVADFHTYFVSSLGIWVHNITCLPETSFTTKKLQHEWSHAGDFGIKGNWNKANGELYEKAITNELKSATNVWKSTYRGDSVYVYYNKNTGVGMYTDLNGNYVGGWKFSQAQLEFHQKNGTVLFTN